MHSKHVATSTTAQTVTLQTTSGEPGFTGFVVATADASAPIYWTFTTNATEPETAVVAAEDTAVVNAGLPAIPYRSSNPFHELRVSVIAASGTPTVNIIAT